MYITLNYKFFLLLFTIIILITVFFTSCRRDPNHYRSTYRSKTNEVVDTNSSPIQDHKNSKAYNDSLAKHFSTLVKTQFYYTEAAKEKSRDKRIVDFANTIIIEYQNILKEMSILVQSTTQDSIINLSDKRLVLHKLENSYSKDYESLFLEETIKLQFSIREVLWQIKNNTLNTDLQVFYEKIIQETEIRIDEATNLLDNV
ncbi:hypothetical protein HMPREF9711_00550 [Myroides odoratimimus CCUG 3837]|nr:hypothetical protein HMPREF9711_00550 [Myroides odoratimimus CCUG 3837]